jgi:hypothetical protein
VLPEQGVQITKARYRLQRKLQAALSRVVEVLVSFHNEGVAPNTKNLLLMGELSRDLMHTFLRCMEAEEGSKIFVREEVAEMALQEIRLKRQQTKKRRARKHRTEETIAREVIAELIGRGLIVDGPLPRPADRPET